jgi:hypothetical protein
MDLLLASSSRSRTGVRGRSPRLVRPRRLALGTHPSGGDAEFERLVDSVPNLYLRRLDREDPGKHLRWGRNVVVKVSEAGIRYLREQ